MIPGLVPGTTPGSSFLNDAFRNRPGMKPETVGSTPKINPSGTLPDYTKPKFSTGTQPKIKPGSPFKPGQGV